MRISGCGYTLCCCVAAAMLAGCAGSQPPIGAPDAMPQASTLAAHADRDTSWMLPEAKRDDLLYVTGSDDNIYVFAYPTGKLVGEFRPPNYAPQFLCADSKGDVFVPVAFISTEPIIYEYAHGGTKPIATLTAPYTGTGALACSVDPVTGDLAVSVASGIEIFKGARGNPTLIQSPDVIFDCAYSEDGDLFASPWQSRGGSKFLYMLGRSGSSFGTVTLNEGLDAVSIQWVDGKLVVAALHHGSRGPQEIYQIRISGSRGTVGAPIDLDSRGDRKPGRVQFWITGKTLVEPDHPPRNHGLLNFWRFPQGGEPTKTLIVHPDRFYGLTFSRAT
jgi:hypothetical protein